LLYFSTCTLLTDVDTVVVTLQYVHNISTYVATVVVVLHITFMDVATVVAGTAAVSAVHGTHVTKL